MQKLGIVENSELVSRIVMEATSDAARPTAWGVDIKTDEDPRIDLGVEGYLAAAGP